MIKGRNIILRNVRHEDIDTMYNLSVDLSETGEYWHFNLAGYPKFKKMYEENGWWDKENGMLLITDKEGKILGHISFFKSSGYQSGYEIGYRLYRQEDRGKGYMSEALRIFTAYLFLIEPIPRLYLTVIKGNTASRRTAEKCGFTYIGTMPKAVYRKSRFDDLELFSLLREDCPTFDEVMADLK